jgi:hypothetical protein
MKKIKLITLMLFIGFGISHAQYNTGDTQLNLSLSKIDSDASVNFSLFKKDMSVTYNVTESKVESWSVKFGMKAGDIYLALEIAKILKKPVEDVIQAYTSNKQKGWGAIAKDLGIKPGSPEFHALKGNADKKANKDKGGDKPKGKGN